MRPSPQSASIRHVARGDNVGERLLRGGGVAVRATVFGGVGGWPSGVRVRVAVAAPDGGAVAEVTGVTAGRVGVASTLVATGVGTGGVAVGVARLPIGITPPSRQVAFKGRPDRSVTDAAVQVSGYVWFGSAAAEIATRQVNSNSASASTRAVSKSTRACTAVQSAPAVQPAG